jgi:hemoglobin/transferrin/lactoferrin receptor protein
MMWKKIARYLVLSMWIVLSTSFSISVRAADPSPEPSLDGVIVTARGTGSRISQTPGGVGVVDEETLFEDQPMSITNTTDRIPGVEKSSDSAWGSAINIRGLGRNHVVFLIDGCRVNTATEINAQFGLIDPLEIERIEVLKGPISALYGSGSTGGVVNVITKKGSFSEKFESHGTLAGSVASNPEGYNLYGNASFNSENYWVYASGGYRDHESYEDGAGDEIHNSQFEDYNANVKAGYQWSSAHVSEFQYQYLEGNDIGIPGKGLGALPKGPDITYPDTTRTLAKLSHRFVPDDSILSESSLNLFYQVVKRRVLIEFPPKAPVDTIEPKADHETVGAKWLNRFDLGAHMLTAGIDAWNWKIETERIKNLRNGQTGIDAPLADAEQLSAGIFVENDWHLNSRFTLNAGGRIDYIRAKSDALYNWIIPPAPMIVPTIKRESEEVDDTSWNAHAGVTLNVGPAWSMTGLAASSYRAPDLMDRFKYIVLGSGERYGNPDLDPERSLFFEYGLHYTTAVFSASSSVYYNRIDDLIIDKLQRPGLWQMENVEEAEIYGVELEGKYRLTRAFSLYANAAYTNGKNKTEDENLAFIAPLNGLVGVRYQPAFGFWGDLALKWAARQDEPALDEEETPGWAVINAKCGYRFKVRNTVHDIMVGADNLLDRDYRNHLSTSRGVELTEPGLNLFASWKMEF